MTIDEMIAVLQAYKEGKMIEVSVKYADDWNVTKTSFWDFEKYNYRIKPEPHYRPFKNAEEVMEAIKEHGGWVKVRTSGRYVSINSFDCDYVWFGSAVVGKTYKKGYEVVSFADGTPFGKLVEESK